MAEQISSPKPKKRTSWVRVLGGCLVVVLLLLVVLYFVGTSSAFVKGFILPRAGKSMNAQITAGDVDVSPFSQVVIKNLKVQTSGQEPLLVANSARLNYKLMDIIRGHINVSEIVASGVVVSLVENPDGTSNLDPILKSQTKEKKESPSKEPSKSSKPLQVDIGTVTLTEVTLKRTKLYADGKRDLVELSKVNLTVKNVKNGGTGTLVLAADALMDSDPPSPGTKGVLQARLDGNFSFALLDDLKPASIKGNASADVLRAEGALAQAAGLKTELQASLTPKNLDGVSLRISRGNSALAELRASGPFDTEKMEGSVRIELAGVDKQLLNVAGAPQGLDFGTTTVSSTNLIQLSRGGQAVAVAGQLDLGKLQISRTNQTTPTLDIRANYDLALDRAQTNLTLKAFSLNGTQKGQPLLRGELANPMTISMASSGSKVGDSTLNLSLTNFNFADWRPILGQVAPDGVMNANLKLLQQGGTAYTFDLNAAINDLTVIASTNQVSGLAIEMAASGTASQRVLAKPANAPAGAEAPAVWAANLPGYRLSVTQRQQPVLSVTGSGNYNGESDKADFQLALQSAIAGLANLMPMPDVRITGGNADAKLRVQQDHARRTITGTFGLTDLSGKMASTELRGFGTTMDFDALMDGDKVEIRKMVGKISEAAKPGGSFDVSGTVNLSNKVCSITARLSELNQVGLHAFLDPMLADKKLVSVAMNASAKVDYNPLGDASIKTDLQVTNLVVNDPKNQIPATPLKIDLNLDVAKRQDVVDIRQARLALEPTQVAPTNAIRLEGKIDMSQKTNYQGTVKLLADTLDLTRYYELFSGSTNAPEAAASTSTRPAVKPSGITGPEKEREAMELPLRDFTVEAALGRIVIKETEISNVQAVAKIDRTNVIVKPFKLQLNKAPVGGELTANLGVPGFRYALKFSGQTIPLAPLVNTFQPERKGQIGGTVTASGDVKGAGTIWSNVYTNLSGSFYMGSTNLNLSVVHIRSPLLRTLINVIATVPDLLKNPDSAVSSFMSALGDKASAGNRGGLSDELEKSPLDKIVVGGTIGDKKFTVSQSLVESSTFQAQANGNVGFEPIATNSTIQFPVKVALSRAVAQKVGLGANTPTNVAYVSLPDFLTMKGTVGKPKSDINKLAIAGTLLQGIGGVPGLDTKTGNLLQSLGSALTGGKAGSTNASTGTNAPAQNNLLQGLGDLLNQKSKTGTNAAPQGSGTSTNRNSGGGLLDNLLGPKK